MNGVNVIDKKARLFGSNEVEFSTSTEAVVDRYNSENKHLQQ